MVLMEAVTAGVPVVAFAVGGIPAVLGDDGGWLVGSGDVDALAAAMYQALGDPSEASCRAARARERLEARYGRARWQEQIERVYHRVLGA